MFNKSFILVSFLVVQVHPQLFPNAGNVPTATKELNIINHSIKYSLAKIKAALSPSNLDIIEEQQKQNEDFWKLRGFKSYRGCPDASRQLKIFKTGPDYYAAVATASSVNNTEIHRFTSEHGCEEKIATLPTRDAFDFEVISTDDAVRLIVLEERPLAHPHRRTGSQVYTIFSSNSSQLMGTKAEVLLSERPTCITSWVQSGVPHVAICNNKTGTPSYIYCARGGYFDNCGQVDSYSPTTIKHFSFYSDHYLIVINQPDESKGRHVFTEILRYDLSTESYKHFQYLPSKAAADVCFFTMGSNLGTEHYLVVAVNRKVQGANDEDQSSHVYKVVDGKFEPFQTIPTRRALGCLAYQAQGGHSALMFSESFGIVAYQYNGWRFVKVVEYSKHAMGEGAVNLRSLSIKPEVFITVTNKNPSLSGENNIFLPEFYSLSRNGAPGSRAWHNNAFNWCRSSLTSLKKDPFAVITDSYSSSVKKNDTDIKLGSASFQNLTAHEVLANEIQVEQNRSRMGAVQFTIMKDLLSEVTKLTAKIDRLAEEMSRVISTTGTFVIEGPVRLHSLKSSCRNGCRVDQLLSGTVNNIDVNEIYNNSIRINATSIPSSINLSLLQVAGGVDASYVANKSIDDFLSVNSDIVFNNSVVIVGSVLIHGNVSVSGLIDGRNISSSNLMRNGTQNLKGKFQAGNLIFGELNAGRINGMDVNDLYSKSLNRTSNLTLVRPTFKHGMDVTRMTLNGLVNSINLEETYAKSMKVNGDQVVTGFHAYNGAHVINAELEGKFNWRDFPADFIGLGEQTTVSLKKLRLTGHSHFTNLIVEQNLSGIALVDGRPSGNIFLHSMNATQTVTGSKTFHNVQTGGNVITSGTINKHPPLDFKLDEAIFGDSKATALITGGLNVQGPLITTRLRVKTLKDMDLRRLEANGVSLLSKNLPVTLSPTFTSDVLIGGDLKADTISTTPMEHFIERSKGPVIINTTKRFLEDLTIRGSVNVRGAINGHNLSQVWSNSLKPTGDQIITGIITVENDVNFQSIQSAKSQMIPLRSLNNLTGTKHFTDLEIEGDWSVHVMDVEGLVNDVNISAWSIDTLFKTGNGQLIESPKKINKLTAGNATIHNTTNINLNELNDIVLTNQSTVIASDLVIVGSFLATEMNVSGKIDGVDSELPLYWLRNSVQQNISGSIHVQGSLHAHRYKQDSWNVGEIDVDELLRSAVKTDQDQFFPSLQISHVTVNNINVNGTVQKRRVSEEFVRKSDNLQTITGNKLFKGPLTLDSVHVVDSINGETPSKLCERPPPPQPSKWIIRGDFIIAQDAHLSIDRINDETLEDLTSQVWYQDTNVVVTHRQWFDDVVIEGNVLSNAVVNNVNLSDLNRRYVSTSSPNELTALYEFDSLHIRNGLFVDFLNATSVNDLETNHFKDSVLLRSREQDLSNKITFESFQTKNIFLTGMVNGVDVNASAIRKDRSNIIVAKKTFSSLKVDGNMEPCPMCLVDGVDVSQWASNAVLRLGNVTVSSPVDLDIAIFDKPLSLQGKMNGIVVRKDNLMTLSDDQNVHAPVSFSSKLPHELVDHPIIADDFNLAAQVDDLDVNGLYDSVNLTRFYNDTVQSNTNLHFNQPVIISELDVEFLIDDATNSTISDIVNGRPENHYHHPDTDVNSSAFESMLESISQVAARQAIQLKYFEAAPLPINMTTPIGAVYAWKLSSSEDVYMCYTNGAYGHLYCGSSRTPVVESVEVTSLSALSQHLAVTWKTSPDNAAIFSKIGSNEHQFRRQNLATKSALDSAAFVWNNRSCFLMAQEFHKSHIYCQHRPGAPFSLVKRLPISNARMVSVGYFQDTGLPLIIVAGSNGTGAWTVDPKMGTFFELSAVFGASAIIAIDSMCDDVQCYIVTVAPPEPVAIPGQIIIWGLNSYGKSARLQRISVPEPMDVKFFRLPNGRLALAVLQCSGIDNVMVYVLKGFSQFEHVTTIHVPGAMDFQVIADATQVLMMLTISQPSGDGSNAVRLFRAHFLDLLI